MLVKSLITFFIPLPQNFWAFGTRLICWLLITSILTSDLAFAMKKPAPGAENSSATVPPTLTIRHDPTAVAHPSESPGSSGQIPSERTSNRRSSPPSSGSSTPPKDGEKETPSAKNTPPKDSALEALSAVLLTTFFDPLIIQETNARGILATLEEQGREPFAERFRQGKLEAERGEAWAKVALQKRLAMILEETDARTALNTDEKAALDLFTTLETTTRTALVEALAQAAAKALAERKAPADEDEEAATTVPPSALLVQENNTAAKPAAVVTTTQAREGANEEAQSQVAAQTTTAVVQKTQQDETTRARTTALPLSGQAADVLSLNSDRKGGTVSTRESAVSVSEGGDEGEDQVKKLLGKLLAVDKETKKHIITRSTATFLEYFYTQCVAGKFTKKQWTAFLLSVVLGAGSGYACKEVLAFGVSGLIYGDYAEGWGKTVLYTFAALLGLDAQSRVASVVLPATQPSWKDFTLHKTRAHQWVERVAKGCVGLAALVLSILPLKYLYWCESQNIAVAKELGHDPTRFYALLACAAPGYLGNNAVTTITAPGIPDSFKFIEDECHVPYKQMHPREEKYRDKILAMVHEVARLVDQLPGIEDLQRLYHDIFTHIIPDTPEMRAKIGDTLWWLQYGTQLTNDELRDLRENAVLPQKRDVNALPISDEIFGKYPLPEKERLTRIREALAGMNAMRVLKVLQAFHTAHQGLLTEEDTQEALHKRVDNIAHVVKFCSAFGKGYMFYWLIHSTLGESLPVKILAIMAGALLANGLLGSIEKDRIKQLAFRTLGGKKLYEQTSNSFYTRTLTRALAYLVAIGYTMPFFIIGLQATSSWGAYPENPDSGSGSWTSESASTNSSSFWQSASVNVEFDPWHFPKAGYVVLQFLLLTPYTVVALARDMITMGNPYNNIYSCGRTTLRKSWQALFDWCGCLAALGFTRGEPSEATMRDELKVPLHHLEDMLRTLDHSVVMNLAELLRLTNATDDAEEENGRVIVSGTFSHVNILARAFFGDAAASHQWRVQRKMRTQRQKDERRRAEPLRTISRNEFAERSEPVFSDQVFSNRSLPPEQDALRPLLRDDFTYTRGDTSSVNLDDEENAPYRTHWQKFQDEAKEKGYALVIAKTLVTGFFYLIFHLLKVVFW